MSTDKRASWTKTQQAVAEVADNMAQLRIAEATGADNPEQEKAKLDLARASAIVHDKTASKDDRRAAMDAEETAIALLATFPSTACMAPGIGVVGGGRNKGLVYGKTTVYDSNGKAIMDVTKSKLVDFKKCLEIPDFIALVTECMVESKELADKCS